MMLQIAYGHRPDQQGSGGGGGIALTDLSVSTATNLDRVILHIIIVLVCLFACSIQVVIAHLVVTM